MLLASTLLSLSLLAPPGQAGEAPAGVPIQVPAPPAGDAAPVAASGPLDLRVRVFVGDLPQLAELVRQDAALRDRADDLRGRRTTAAVLGGTAVASLVLLPLLSFADETCESRMGLQYCQPQPRLAIAGLAAGAILGGIALAVAPSRGEILDLVSRWNLRHPDRQLAPDPWLGAAVGVAPAESPLPGPPPSPPPPEPAAPR